MKKIPQLSDRPDDDGPDDVAPGETGPSSASADAPRDRKAPDDEAAASATGAPDVLAAVADAVGRSDDTTSGGSGETASGGRSDVGGDAEASSAAGPAPAGRAGGPRSGKRKSGRPPARGPARRFARERALQALYQWDLADAESSTVRREFIERQDMSRVDVEYFERLFRGISHDVEKVDAALADALDRPLGEVDPIERAVLRIAAFELAEVLETPARVVINEGVEITKRFGADNGHRYVNGVLDGLAATLRPLEMRRG